MSNSPVTFQVILLLAPAVMVEGSASKVAMTGSAVGSSSSTVMVRFRVTGAPAVWVTVSVYVVVSSGLTV